MRERLEQVSRVLCAYPNQIEFEGPNYAASNDIINIGKAFEDIGITTSSADGILQIKAKNYIGQNCFYYEAVPQHFKLELVDNEFSVISLTGEFYIYSAKDGFSFGGNATDGFKGFCQNLTAYFKLYNYLVSKDFSDHHNHANTEIVIYNSAKGIFKIRYEIPPEIPNAYEFSSSIAMLLEYSKPIELKLFFKNALYTVSQDSGYMWLGDIIRKATEIVTITKRDHALVSKQFDFDKFRDSLYKEKDKYFLGIREILSKMFSQAIGIPISISAALFASYKVSDDSFLMLLVLSSFILYVYFYVRIQLSYKRDLNEFQRDFQTNFQIIKSKSGLPEDLIEDESDKISRKIQSSLSLVQQLIEFVIGLGLYVVAYIGYLLYLKYRSHF